jgi:hypothetical protein
LPKEEGRVGNCSRSSYATAGDNRCVGGIAIEIPSASSVSSLRRFGLLLDQPLSARETGSFTRHFDVDTSPPPVSLGLRQTLSQSGEPSATSSDRLSANITHFAQQPWRQLWQDNIDVPHENFDLKKAFADNHQNGGYCTGRGATDFHCARCDDCGQK